MLEYWQKWKTGNRYVHLHVCIMHNCILCQMCMEFHTFCSFCNKYNIRVRVGTDSLHFLQSYSVVIVSKPINKINNFTGVSDVKHCRHLAVARCWRLYTKDAFVLWAMKYLFIASWWGDFLNILFKAGIIVWFIKLWSYYNVNLATLLPRGF